MSKQLERGVLIREGVVKYPMELPDGIVGDWVFLSTGIESGEFEQIAKNKMTKMLTTRREVRMISDEGEKISNLGRYLDYYYPEVNSKYGGTTFFESPLRNSHVWKNNEALSHMDWWRYRDRYRLISVGPDERELLDVVKALLIGSFGMTKTEEGYVLNSQKTERIHKSFLPAIYNPDNHLYMVIDEQVDKAVGSFILKPMEEIGEIQLHSVAGRAIGDSRVVQTSGKLAIIGAALYEAIDRDFGDNDLINRLTFSSSGAAPLYQNLGFPVSGRNGVVLIPSV